ncbi:TlpA family protein disulfide reductase [Aestuariibaculum suncheonense]|uniref:TlpA family protein disulfide reductase n=1 Tax=Aestuariibaculum suncheonense TaxID=1028745 RepID=A0A8J6Q5A6_9FLAO|nr:TlpA disulfide reductase family protein [Aestuariibaculum suncheonense]MBD0834439.1 TlpA family protein disulfide reductase [Aestuariibaculum suncheonense]
MKFNILFFTFLLIVGCKWHENNAETALVETWRTEFVVHEDFSKDLKVYDFKGLEPLLNKKDGKVHVVNFWATWCVPCVKELPYFEQLQKAYAHKNVEVLLVSLDFPHQYDTKLKPFINERKIQSQVVALDDADMNAWIPKVDASWSGSIPATIIYKDDERQFFEQSFTFEELEKQVKPFLN